MSATKDIQLKGTNLCNIEVDCQDRNSIVHPETCTDNVLTTHNGSVTLTEWLTYNEVDPTTPLDGFGSYDGLIPWLEHYYPHNSYNLPMATTTTLGGIVVGNDFNIDNNGVLSLNTEIPTITKASYGTNTVSTDYTINGYGTIKLGNDTVISSDFGNSTISYDSSYKFPLRLDSKGRAGIEINAALFGGQEQSNWYQNDNTQPDYIKNKPTLATVATTGSYDDLVDKPAIGQVNDAVLTIKYGNTTLSTFSANADSNTTVTIPTGLNYLIVEELPTENISTTTIYLVPKEDVETGDVYDEWMYINKGTAEVPDYEWEKIGNTQVTYTLPLAADGTRGGIQLGYTQNNKNYPVRLSNEQAYVNVPWQNTEYTTFTGATVSADGTTGLVPAPTHLNGDDKKFLKGNGTWGIPDSTTYTAGEGIDITNEVISQEVATSSTIGGIKTGFTSTNEDLSAVQIVTDSTDSNYNKAYVNISNRSLKNHRVTAINQEVFDEYHNHFDTYTVKCEISNEDLKVVNVNDFKQTSSGYIHPSTITTTDVYEWVISSASANNTIGIINAIATAAKGYFQLIIDHGNNLVETHNVGFIIDTPNNNAFAWFSTCAWGVSLYNTASNSCRVYLTVPADFTGTVKITNIHLVTYSGGNVGSMDGTTSYRWDDNTPFTNGSVTAISGTLVSTPQPYEGASEITVPTGYKVPVDAFVTLNYNPTVGDLLYDSEINDALIHNLSFRLKSLEQVVNGLVTAVNQLNVSAIETQ